MPPLVVGIGEVTWDLFPRGRRLGGAPGNFAYHASRLGCRGALVSRVGHDDLGREALAKLDALGVDRSRVQLDPSLPTSTVDVALDPQGCPTFLIHENIAWDALEAPESLLSYAPEAAAIAFGTLASRDPRSRAAILRFLEAAGPRCLRIFDVNLRQGYHEPDLIRASLERCEVLKVNEDELPRVAGWCGVAPDAEALRARYGLKLVALTLGGRGSILCTPGQRREEPGLTVPIADTVGAGDAFTAALAAGMVLGADLTLTHRRAARLSAYVCTQVGATPETADFLRSDPCFH